jgi:hypothetical protein
MPCRLWYGEPNAISNAIDYAKLRNRSHDAVIRVYHEAGNVIETQQHTGDFKDPFVRSRHLTIIQNRVANPKKG